MNEITTERLEGKLTIGVDLGDRSSQCCVLDPQGEVLEESSLPHHTSSFSAVVLGQGSGPGDP